MAKGQYWTAVQQLKWRDWQGIFVRMPGTASQSPERRNVGGVGGRIWACDKKMPEIDRYCTGVSRRYRPFSIPPGPKRTRWYSRQERGRCFHVIQHSREQLWRPAFLWQSFFRKVEHTPSPIAYRKVCTFRVSCSVPCGWNLGHVSLPSIFNTNPRSPFKAIFDNCLGVFSDHWIPYSSRDRRTLPHVLATGNVNAGPAAR